MSTRFGLILISVAACGGSDGDKIDAPVVAGSITVTGTAEELGAGGGGPVEGLLVEAFANSADTVVVATAMTDASGNYSIVVDTNGAPLDGFLKATKTGLKVTYLYPDAPLAANFDGASLKMVTENTFGLLANTLCRANQDTAKGTVAVLVNDAAAMPVAGAMVSSSPASNKYCYNAGAFPSSTATETDVDGVGYMFNVTGSVTVSASKSGETFRSHSVTARADALTTTLIAP